MTNIGSGWRALQDKLYAEGKNGILIIFQAMDAAGKDGAVRHVFSGLNPQGVDVYNFKQPSAEEQTHDYLWRAQKNVPSRGKIAIFNRSYYEDVLIAKVHKLYLTQNLPDRCLEGSVIDKRYEQIKNFEQYLWENGITLIKCFLHISKDEQKKAVSGADRGSVQKLEVFQERYARARVLGRLPESLRKSHQQDRDRKLSVVCASLG